MEIWEWIVLAVAIGLVALLAIAFVRIRQRRAHLKDRLDRKSTRLNSSHRT